MDNLEDEEEDVIIQGSELHQALLSMGYTDFEFATINAKNNTLNEPSLKDHWLKSFLRIWENWQPLGYILNSLPKSYYLSLQQFKTILKAESLLDDHAARVQDFALMCHQPFRQKFETWSHFLVSNIMLGVSYSMFKRKKYVTMFLTTSISAYTLSCKYKEFRAIRILRDLVDVQNELYHLYKKSLGIFKNVYHLSMEGTKPQLRFSKLEVDHLKYLQPLMETFLKSMETVSRLYYYATSTVCKYFPKGVLDKGTVSHFESDSFMITGEVTYTKLRQLYYVYVLVQSDFMHLLAMAYNIDLFTHNGKISHSLLEQVMSNLHHSLIHQKNKLTNILSDYRNCERKVVDRKIRIKSVSRWRDLYLNLDVLSRKLQVAYDEVASVLETIEKHGNNEEANDEYVAELNAKIQDIYVQIDKSRSFAEFNNLLMAIIQRSRRPEENATKEIEPVSSNAENDELIVVRDTEPQIIDEVFEEYITEEYLKPLYDEDDEATVEIAKFDKLLAKNFMSELKEALVEKCKSMSEREARAWLRKYRASSNRSERNNSTEIEPMNNENAGIPVPPPLPIFREMEEKVSEEQGRPVLLPRMRTFEKNSSRIPIPPPPPLPPRQIESPENTEKLSIGLPSLNARKIPAFVTFEEEFIGSGENSEDDLEEDENEATS